MREIMKTMKVILQVVRISFSQFTEYRVSFAFSLVSTLMWMAGMFIYYEGIFGNVDTIAGYDRADLLLLLAVSQFFAMMYFMVFGARFHLDDLIRDFGLDFYLLKPLNQMLYTTLSFVAVRNIAVIVPTMLLFRTALLAKEYTIGISELVMFAVATVVSLTCYYLLILIGQLVSFWVINSDAKYIMSEVHDVLQLPQEMFPDTGLKRVLVFVVPLFLLTNVPFHALLGDLEWWMLAVLMVNAVVMYAVASRMWKRGVARYCDID